MKNRMEAISGFLVMLVMLICSFISNNLQAETKTRSLNFLFTSDLHGWLSTSWMYPRRNHAGLLHLKKHIVDMKRQDANLILIDAGDLLQGSPLVHYHHYVNPGGIEENPFFKLINELEYDAVVVGNHDLSLNPDFETNYVPKSNFSWLAANIHRGGKNIFKPYLVLKQNSIKIVVLGFTTPGVHLWLGPEQLQGIQVEPLEKSVPKWIRRVQSMENPDFLLGVFHVGLNFYRDDENSKLRRVPPANDLRMVLENNNSFDLVVSGHDHRLFPYKSGQKPKSVSGTPVISPGHTGEAAIYTKVDVEKHGQNWQVATIDISLKKSRYNKKIASDIARYTSEEFKNYINEMLPWSFNLTSKDKVRSCLNLLLSLACDEKELDGTFFPSVSVYGLKQLVGRNLRRSDLFNWVKYDNKSVTVRLNKREISLLTSPRPEFGAYKAPYNRILVPWIKKEFGIEKKGFLLAKNSFNKKYRVKLTDYHFWGGGGIRSKLFLTDSDREATSGKFQRDQLFLFLSNVTSLPKVCSFLRYNPI